MLTGDATYTGERSGTIGTILAKLMLLEQAAKLFLADAPRLAVFSHILKKGFPGGAGDNF
ncbi:MAG: hypothetical protein M3Z23_17140 [Acidobacteriota bacterium]|nr:hypothetical protein [Acidobacteriota bacterium]